MTERQRIGNADYDVIADQEDGGGGYEWEHVALVRRDDGQLFLLNEGGCSCNAPWDYPQESDLAPVTSWQEAVDKLKADQPYMFNDDDVAAFAQKLMELRPAPSPKP